MTFADQQQDASQALLQGQQQSDDTHLSVAGTKVAQLLSLDNKQQQLAVRQVRLCIFLSKASQGQDLRKRGTGAGLGALINCGLSGEQFDHQALERHPRSPSDPLKTSIKD